MWSFTSWASPSTTTRPSSSPWPSLALPTAATATWRPPTATPRSRGGWPSSSRLPPGWWERAFCPLVLMPLLQQQLLLCPLHAASYFLGTAAFLHFNIASVHGWLAASISNLLLLILSFRWAVFFLYVDNGVVWFFLPIRQHRLFVLGGQVRVPRAQAWGGGRGIPRGLVWQGGQGDRAAGTMF